MTIGDALKSGARELQTSGVSEPIASARLLLQRLLDKTWSELFRDASQEFSAEQQTAYRQMIERRTKHEPVDYIAGWTYFSGLKLNVTPDTLIPRVETEMLVGLVLDYIATEPKEFAAIIDVGTGSGAIALALAQWLETNNYPFHVTGTDTSAKAIAVAKANAQTTSLSEHVSFITTNLLPEIVHVTPIIVANLPYIPSERIATLESDVRDFEPHQALDGGPDGLDLYRQLFEQIAKQRITPRAIFCEIDETQGQSFPKLAKSYFPDATVDIRKDLAGLDRFAQITLA